MRKKIKTENEVLQNPEVQERVMNFAQELFIRNKYTSIRLITEQILFFSKKRKNMSEIAAIPQPELYRFLCDKFIVYKILPKEFSPYSPLDYHSDGNPLLGRFTASKKGLPDTAAEKRINKSQQELRVSDAMMGDGSHTVEFAMLFDSDKKANQFVKDLLIVLPGLKKEK